MKILLFCSLFLTSTATWAVPAEGHRLMIAAPSPRAIEAGQKIAQKGGNVVDVAVAVELALSVTSPYYASLGGGGFAMIRMGGKDPQALDFRETAPILTHPDFYISKDSKASTIGALAVGIPGIPAGIWELHQKHGKLKWKQLFEDAIRLAEQGFPVTGEWVRRTNDTKKDFNPSAIKYLYKKGEAYKPGEILKQPQLGKALRQLRDQGPKAFYRGDIGKDVVSTLKKTGGVMAVQDLHNYKPRWLTPIKKDYLGHTVHMMPPPSSSGVVTSAIIGLLEQIDMKKFEPTSSAEYHHLAEIFKIAFRGRALLGDPDFHQNPIELLTSAEYLKPLAKKISPKKTLALAPIEDNATGKKESSETTNFTVMDVEGNTVVMTITLNGNYGSAMVSDKYGIALNNEMDDFTTRPNEPNMFGLIQGKANAVQAGKRPLSSMSPTIITKDGKTVLGAGGSGGPRIITSVFQAWYRAIANGFDMDRAIQTPRIHHQFMPNTLYVEYTFPVDTKLNLEKLGHKTESSWVGRANGIKKNDKGILEAAFDSRVEGGAGGI